MKAVKARLVLFILALAIWFLLTYPYDVQELIAGSIITLLIAVMPLPGIDVLGEFRWTPKALVYSIAYVFYFMWQLVKANLDVAFRVLHPRLPIEPGIVKVKTTLTSRLGRLILANSITLTPGTITVESNGEDFYVHWIKVEGEQDKERTKKIVAGFEKYLEVICG
jgi:multicomponent Na+:H+ antiporter subunit E